MSEPTLWGKRIRIVWPEDRLVSELQVIEWARDDIANGKYEDVPLPTVVAAMKVLEETGTVTLANSPIHGKDGHRCWLDEDGECTDCGY